MKDPMTVLFWLSLAFILYTYLGYPLAIALLARLHPLPWIKAPWPADVPPVSVVMAVHNGAAMLPAKLADLLTLEPHLIREIIVVSDGSTDATRAILAEPQPPRPANHFFDNRWARRAALNHGVAAAESEIILFVDIRPRIQPGRILAALLSNFADPRGWLRRRRTHLELPGPRSGQPAP